MMSPTILTASGISLHLTDPRPEQICIADIAHALAHLCRFTGHTRVFYSVAQHSVHASYLVPPEHALAALLHDAAEAYIGDVATPLKALLPDYHAIERRMEATVRAAFGLPAQLPDCVKLADLTLLATERRDLMPDTPEEWLSIKGLVPLSGRLIPLKPPVAQTLFLQRFADLTQTPSSAPQEA